MTPYEAGVHARKSNDPEPKNPYVPGSEEYRQFVDGWFKARPFSPRAENYIRQFVIERHRKERTA